MTRKFKVGDKVLYTLAGQIGTGTIIGPCGAPNYQSGVCFRIQSDNKGVWDAVHKREEYLTLVPQNLDQLQGKVDEALDRLEQVEGRVDKLEQAGGTPLVDGTPQATQDAQNPTRKFRVGDRVLVKATVNSTMSGKVGVIVRLNRKRDVWGYDYQVKFAGPDDWGFSDDELEPAPERKLQVGDVVEIVWEASAYKGKSGVVLSISNKSLSALAVTVHIESQDKTIPYKFDELVLLRTAEEDAKLKADERNALKERALKALEKLTYDEELDVRDYLKGDSE